MNKRYTLTPWSKLTVFRFSEALMRTLVTVDQTKSMSCYHIRLTRDGVMKPAYHKKASELIWFIKGRGVAELAGRRVRIKTGDVLFIPALTAHGFSTSSSLEMLAMLTPRVDSKTDFYPLEDGSHGVPHVITGRLKEGR